MFNPVKVTDVTLRDGLEDFVLKHFRLEDLARFGELLDRAGFYSIDCWGGATFYAALADLREDPWERLKKLRRALRHTPIQMILRGHMLVGFKPYQDEVVRKFMARAANLGVDIFRVYDNLNDLDNMAAVIATGKELRKQVEATVLFSLNPHITNEDYLNLAGGLINLGADVICINDSYGVINPHQVATLVNSYRRYYLQPFRLHLHNNHQTAITSYQEGIRQGVEMVDTTLAALAWPYGPPPVESLMSTLGGSPHDPHIEPDILAEASDYLDFLKEKYRYQEPPPRKLDDSLGPGYLPGPLKEFIREEMIRREARDRQQAAYKEAQQVWGDLGYPVLKGRILEFVGVQAVENLFTPRRYDKLTQGMRDLIRGKYGRLHSPVTEELQFLALAGGETPGAEAPEMAGPLLSLPELTAEEDILTYSLFPEEAEALFYQRSQPAPPSGPQAPIQAAAIAAQPAIRRLTLAHKGEEVQTRLEGVGPMRKGRQVIFIHIGDQTEEVEVQLAPDAEGKPEYLISFHSETYRIKVGKTFPKEQEYTPMFLEVNGNRKEFLIKHPEAKG